MYGESDIQSAVEAGAISPEAAAALRSHVASLRTMPAVDEESFRLLTGFNDIFVTIAAVLMLFALGWLGNTIRVFSPEFGPSPMVGIAVAAGAWGLAEYFTRKRRMALPSIVLLLAFAGSVFGSLSLLLGVLGGEDSGPRAVGLILAGAGALTAAAVWLHWRRFHVPITVAAGAATMVALLIGLAIAGLPQLMDHVLPLVLVAGLGTFGLAMWWDMSDRTRTTRRSDVAFWLHLLAAPMIVHPIFAMLGVLDGDAAPGHASIVILIYILLGLVALAIDRRALMVSALAYVLFAMTSLIQETAAIDRAFGLTALIIGSALLLLSAFWTTARGHIVRLLPRDVCDRLPAIDRPLAA